MFPSLGCLGLGQLPFTEQRPRLDIGAVEIGRATLGNVILGGVGFPQFTQVSIVGSTSIFSTGSITPVTDTPVIVTPSFGGGGGFSMGSGVRIPQNKQMALELALHEDKLLLAIIKSTLQNPKYGF